MTKFYCSLTAILIAAGCGGSEAAPTLDSGLPSGVWVDATAETIGETGDWTNKVDLADLNGDGLVDILFANGGNYREPGEPVASKIFLNQGPGKMFLDATKEVFGEEPMICRVIKTADVNGDGAIDIFFGATFETASRLLLGDGKGSFSDVSETHLPSHKLSLGDAEFGDVDFDGDLDLLLATWGPGNPMENEGGPALLWLNDGDGMFSPSVDAVPEKKIRMSWDIEWADVDYDYDLDILVSSKRSEGGSIFINDGSGKFTDGTEGKLPQLTNNYEFEPVDLNGDGALDTFTINDGGLIEGTRGSRKESVFFGDGKGGFTLATAKALPDGENLGYDDNRIIAFDFDSDGDVDILIGSLSGPDRLAINDGAGHFTTAVDVVVGPESRGTLGVQAADLNGDHKIDLVMAQGEAEGYEAEMVFFGSNMPADSAPPKIEMLGATEDGCVRARIYDGKSPTRTFDFTSVEARLGEEAVPMAWYGEHLWVACAETGAAGEVTVVAVDAAGNAAEETVALP